MSQFRHGGGGWGAGPCFFMDWTRGPADTWDATAAWLKGLVAGLPERPKAILVISGHWEEPQFTGTGFPGDFYINYHLYRLVFPVSALGRYLRIAEGAA